MKCKMCYQEIDESRPSNYFGVSKQCGCLNGACPTHYHEILRINMALRSHIHTLRDRWLHSDRLHRNVEEFIQHAFELTGNIRRAALEGRDGGDNDERPYTPAHHSV